MNAAAEEVNLNVNGEIHKVCTAPATPLLRLLREQLGLVGTKEACGRGECGACTVLVDGVPVMSCIIRTEEVVDRQITTIEGLSEPANELRAAFADAGAFQCGYCTPGQVVRAWPLLDRVSTMTDAELRHAIAGNICRCTGYAQIVDAIRRAVVKRNAAARGERPR